MLYRCRPTFRKLDLESFDCIELPLTDARRKADAFLAGDEVLKDWWRRLLKAKKAR